MEENKEKQKEQEVEKAKEKAKELLKTLRMEEMISDNKIEFEYNNKKYRVRTPTHKEKIEVNKKRIEKQVAMLKEKDENGNFKYMSEKDLYNLYKERGIDLKEYDRKIALLRKREADLLNQLGKALKEKESEQAKISLKKEIEEVRNRIDDIILERTQLLEASIEQQINLFLYGYFTTLLTEVQEGDNWKRVWNSYSDYENEKDDDLINLATSYTTLLLVNKG